MASFGNVTARGDAASLMPEEFSDAILERLMYQSSALANFSPVRMARKQTRMPVLAGLAMAYFVNGNTGSDTGLINTTSSKWDNKYLNAEEIAVILPIPKAVLDDAEYDVWSRLQSQAEQAIARTLDAAVFFGLNKPESWGPSIWGGIQNALVSVNGAGAAEPVVTSGTADTDEGGVAEDINNVMAYVENSGFDVNMMVAQTTMKAPLRALRDANGQRLFDVQVGPATSTIEGLKPVPRYTVQGVDVDWAMAGLWTLTSGLPIMFIGDKSEGIIGVRADIEASVLDQAVIQDATGRIIFNTAQQNMVALKLVCRYAWEVANTINWLQQNESARFPFAALLHA